MQSMCFSSFFAVRNNEGRNETGRERHAETTSSIIRKMKINFAQSFLLSSRCHCVAPCIRIVIRFPSTREREREFNFRCIFVQRLLLIAAACRFSSVSVRRSLWRFVHTRCVTVQRARPIEVLRRTQFRLYYDVSPFEMCCQAQCVRATPSKSKNVIHMHSPLPSLSQSVSRWSLRMPMSYVATG